MRELQELTAQLIERDGADASCLALILTKDDLPPKYGDLVPEEVEDLFDQLMHEMELETLAFELVKNRLAGGSDPRLSS